MRAAIQTNIWTRSPFTVIGTATKPPGILSPSARKRYLLPLALPVMFLQADLTSIWTYQHMTIFTKSASLSSELWESFLLMEDQSTSSERSFATLRWWLSDCRSRHTSCGIATKQSWFPTRLIDVNSDPKLVITTANHPDPSESYVTLSHCWGTAPISRLTTSTIAVFQTAMSLSILPKTFRDAILVTRRLGFKYLRIDSLCIIQDSQDDWRVESSIMNKVYKRSALTISALDSKNGDGGLFRLREMAQLQPCRAGVLRDLSGEREELYVYSGGAVEEIENGPLSRRAWVLQERLLSPRMVYYGRNQIFWECNELLAGETFPHGIHAWPSMKPSGSWSSTKKKLEPPPIEKPDFPWGKTYRDWQDVVRSYSRASITYKTDKLIAISAIAKEFAALMGNEYVAGLWQNDLLRQLCWFPDGPELDQPLSTVDRLPYQAPSWSWTSLNRLIQNKLNTDWSFDVKENAASADNAEVLDVRITPVGEDTTGQISRGIITIRGPIVYGTFSTTQPVVGAQPWYISEIYNFSDIRAPDISRQVRGNIFWDREPRYETLLALLEVCFKFDIVLILEINHDWLHTRVGLFISADPEDDSVSYDDLFEQSVITNIEIE